MSQIQRFEESSVPDLVNPYDEVMDSVLSGADWLPRVQLCIANSDLVKEGKIDMNHFGFISSKDSIESLGKEVDALLLAWRPRAIDTSDKANIRASSEVKSDLFAEIMDKASEQNSGCMYGPEFLIWVPMKGAYATFIFGGKSTRMEARKVMPFLKKPVTFKSKLIKTPKYSWQSPFVVACSTPFDVPDTESMRNEMEKFLSPPEKAGSEKAPEGVTQDR